ncbi:cytochrome-c oxidase, cbb3-type subunit III [Uliginosibacterium sediminicola]|uniref:Cbb3-type cytochrome c oxidase subunit n=1 Tax=Uliginosibacterium sediminicola TaxID=2024550 RepID=A0ABU9YZX1_9RHOO
MSDFVSDFWSYYVGIAVILSIVACAWLLWVMSRGKTTPNRPLKEGEDPRLAVGTTGHVWDETLEELNNPLPGWWAGLFIITIVFSLVYLVFYPGLGSFQGQFGWTSVKQYEAEKQATDAAVAPLYAKFASLTTEQLAANPDAMAVGERLFLNNCAQCHGSDARGNKGFPNLTDNDWLYGGTPEKIHETITKGRNGVMPSMAAAVGSADDVTNLANYVLSLSQSGGDPLKANLGREKFVVCAACHGPEGKGNQAVGAPNLTDGIWLYGFGLDKVIAAINGGHNGMMPAQEGKLSAGQINILSAYVWHLSNKAP